MLSIEGPAPSGPTCHRAFRNDWPRNVWYGSFSFANRAVLSLQKQNVVLSILKKKKGLGQLLRRKKVQSHAPFGLAGKGQMRQAIQEMLWFPWVALAVRLVAVA